MPAVANAETQRLISDMRGVRYGEVIAAYLRDSGFEAEVYGTQMLNDCPQELWDTLDADVIAAEMGALGVKLNGPRHWMIDGIGQKIAVVDPVIRDFNGLTMRRIAVVNLGDKPAVAPYTEAHVNRGAVFFFDAGSPVYELVNLLRRRGLHHHPGEPGNPGREIDDAFGLVLPVAPARGGVGGGHHQNHRHRPPRRV